MATLVSISPFFIVTNLKTSVSFYVDKLGFEVKFIGPPGDEYFAIVGRDRISIMLKEINPDIQPAPNPARHAWARWDAYIYTAEPDELFEEYSSRHVIFHQLLQNNSDNLRGFEVIDVNGYVLFFGRPGN